MDSLISHPADAADELQRLSIEEAREQLARLPSERAAAILIELNRELWPQILSPLPAEDVARLVAHVSNDQAADLIWSLAPERRRETLAQLPAPRRSEIAALLKYPTDSAGGIMRNQFVAIRMDQTVEQCRQLLQGRAEASTPDSVLYVYVTDEAGKLVGIVPIREMVFRRPDRSVSDIMNRDVKHVSVDDDQEKIARLFEHYHYMALPVVERDGRLVGIVLASDAINVAQKEATEDMQLMVGLSGDERVLSPWKKSFARRLPWLTFNLATAFLAAGVVGLFEETIAAWTALAVFLPIVAGQGGNAGTQTLTVIVREMALGEMSRGDGRKALVKELLLGVLNGLSIGLLVGVVSYWWKGSALLGLVVGFAMLLNMIAAALSGVLVPYTLKALRIDPALASSIFVTTVTDVAGFFFFLGLAALALR